MLLETHWDTIDNYNELFTGLSENCGMELYYKEPNIQNSKGNLIFYIHFFRGSYRVVLGKGGLECEAADKLNYFLKTKKFTKKTFSLFVCYAPLEKFSRNK